MIIANVAVINCQNCKSCANAWREKRRGIEPKDLMCNGLHSKPSAMIADSASRYKSKITFLDNSGETHDGKSIIDILCLCAQTGTILKIKVDGQDENAAYLAVLDSFLYHIIEYDYCPNYIKFLDEFKKKHGFVKNSQLKTVDSIKLMNGYLDYLLNTEACVGLTKKGF